jgi:hypothetical protein
MLNAKPSIDGQAERRAAADARAAGGLRARRGPVRRIVIIDPTLRDLSKD